MLTSAQRDLRPSQTYTTVICPTATTTPKVAEGWTTVVTVCNHCAPKPTTVTLTLPQHGSAAETAAYVAPPHSSSVVPKPGPGAPASVPVLKFVTSTKSGTAVYVTVTPSASKSAAVTHTIVPVQSVPAQSVPACSGSNCPSYNAPAKNATNTHVASTHASSPYGTSTAKPFTGAAVKLGSSVFGLVAMVAVGFALAL